jgi:uncharacterized protein YqeY
MKPIEKINEELKNAMKAQNAQRLSVIRMLKNKILQVNARGEVTDEEASKLYKAYAKQLKETIEMAKTNNKPDVVAETEAELKVVSEFVPAELTKEQVAEIAKAVVAELGKDKSKFGLIMKETMNRAKGQADGGVVKEIVNTLLQ